jgi:large subunit ribosomal protein L19e
LNLKSQRRIAAEILDCGVTRVWIDPTYMEDVADAITRDDIRAAINDGKIRALRVRGTSRGRTRYRLNQKRKGRRKGMGSRKGSWKARTPKKEAWMSAIRSIRTMLKQLRDTERIDRRTYREYYLKAKGGMFRSKAHALSHIKTAGKLKEEAKR